MAKTKTSFFCQNCGTQHAQWQGQCHACKSWNTLVEEIVEKPAPQAWKEEGNSLSNKAVLLEEIKHHAEIRIDTKDAELNRVLGGGMVPGAVILLGGEPGIGKSTLLLQLALSSEHPILYVSGEESQKQIKLRADRMGSSTQKCYVLSETQTSKIFQQIKKTPPKIIIIDSIQTLQTARVESSPGSITQIRECTSELIQYAKETHTPVLLVGHINKEGSIAGPKILEHMVDTVLQFEGDRNHFYRILRAQKNRFGATSEIGIYEMHQNGLQAVSNPSRLLLSDSQHSLSGQSIAAAIEGIRPLLIEVQALVSSAVYGTPQRSSTGFNTKRLNMLLAVLEKRAGFALGSKDVFINLTGGIYIDDPAMDLALVAAILSSHHDIPLTKKIALAGEIGLSGEIRPVPKIEQRIQEAARLGFETIITAPHPSYSNPPSSIEWIAFPKIEDLVRYLFG
jgi:DNA repair protein RadA/Sms